MNKRILSSVLYLISSAAWCFGAEQTVIAIVRGEDIAPYNIALQGFKQVVEKINYSIIFKEYSLEDKNITELIKSAKPNLILTLGTSASKVVHESIKDIPIVFSMVLSHNKYDLRGENISGASLDIPIKTQLKNIKIAFPDKKRIGVIYNSTENQDIIREAKQIAKNMRIVIKAYPIESAKEIPDIKEIKIDVLWFIPDTIVCQSAIVQHILQNSLKYKIPVIGISEYYAKAGAILAMSSDYEDIGEQSAEIAIKILRGEKPTNISVTVPRKVKLYLNLNVAEILGIKIPQEIIKSAEKAFEK